MIHAAFEPKATWSSFRLENMLFPLRKEEKTEKYPLGPIKFPSLHLKDQLERSMIKIRANECLLEKFLRVELICIRALLSTVKLS